MCVRLISILSALILVIITGAANAETPQIRAGVLKIGTVNWELSTIKANALDKANGFELLVQPFADNGATRVALEGGEVDLAVADWLWVARQRAAGKDYIFIPYSKSVGGIVVGKDSSARSLADLKGKKIGIAGGPLDKSWLILQAYARKKFDMDLKASSEQVFGAPPLIFKAGLSGEIDGAINFWHFLAKMKAAGMRELISVSEASQSLGLDPDIPLLGYVMKESFLNENPGIAKAMYGASRAAKNLLATDDSEWDGLRDKMRVRNDKQFKILIRDFRAGIPDPGNVNANSADAFLKLMAELGGEKLIGKATSVPDGLFIALE